VGSVAVEGDAIVVSLTSEERLVLAALATEVGELLAPPETPDADPLESIVGMSSDAAELPDDPVLKRLLPDASDDPEQAAEFRRLTDGDLRRLKNEALESMIGDLGAERVELTEESAATWVQALNDVRLALGTRLDVTEEGEERDALRPDDPRQALFVAYDWLSWLQEAIVTALMEA
jgi:Domain of unknown function (DUF2017)